MVILKVDKYAGVNYAGVERNDLAFVLQQYLDVVTKDCAPGKVVAAVLDTVPQPSDIEEDKLTRAFFRYHTQDRRLRPMLSTCEGLGTGKMKQVLKVGDAWPRLKARLGQDAKSQTYTTDGRLAKDVLVWPRQERVALRFGWRRDDD